MDMSYVSLFAIIISLVCVVVAALKGVKILLIAPVAAVFVAMLSGQNGLAAFTIGYMKAFGNYIISNWPIFIVGALFGLLMDKSQYAQSLAHWVVDKIGEKRGLLTIVFATGLMVYGGVSLFVVTFTIYPIAASVCRRANIPKRLIPGAIGAGAFTWAAYCLPGSPQIQNAMFMPYYGTTLYAAPVLGIIGAIIEIILAVLWLNWRLKKAWASGEGYGNHPDEHLAPVDERKLPSPAVAIVPILSFIALNLLFTYVIFPGTDLNWLTDPLWGSSASAVTGTWSLICSVLISSLLIIMLNLKRFQGMIVGLISDGIQSSIAPITNTAAIIGYGGIIKSVAGFAVISTLMLGISKNPLIAEVISINILSGVSGSASGGIGITLDAFADTFIEMANASGIKLEVLHRIGLIASSGLDSLPHNGAIITTITVCGLTHRTSYLDMFACTVIVPIICTICLIILASLGLQC